MDLKIIAAVMCVLAMPFVSEAIAFGLGVAASILLVRAAIDYLRRPKC